MKAYVVTTGVLFGLLTVAHVLRIMQEGHLATDPFYILITATAAGLSLWAWWVIRRTTRQ